MSMATAEDFEAIRPYNDDEFRAAMRRTIETPVFGFTLKEYFWESSPDEFRAYLESLRGVEEFQAKIIAQVLHVLLKKTSAGLSSGGWSHLDPNYKYLFISNHRDIVLDSALFTRSLFIEGHSTPTICLGDNLLVNKWITDLVKMNKGITVKRNLSSRELLKWSHVLSELIRQLITSKKESVWIAQKDGRTKNGDDRTQSGLIRMLTLSGEGDFKDKLTQLRIVPVAISYEYEPCDLQKAFEEHNIATLGEHHKAPGEDLMSMAEGILAFKGGIHIEVGHEITRELDEAPGIESRKEQCRIVAEVIDRQIRGMYHLWPTNYIAYDLLTAGREKQSHYTPDQEKAFVDRMEKRLSQIDEKSRADVRRRFLEIYATPCR